MPYSVCNNTILEIPKGYLGSWEGRFQSTQKKMVLQAEASELQYNPGNENSFPTLKIEICWN